MQLTDLTLRVVLLFFPGIICSVLVDSLTTHKERTTPQFVVNSFLLGVTSYVVLYVLARTSCLLGRLLKLSLCFDVSFFSTLTSSGTPQLHGWEIVAAASIAVPLGFVVSLFSEQKWVHRAAKSMRVTKKFGELGVWGYMFNSPQVLWVVVRDIKNDMSYEGWVSAFSDTVDEAELLLRNVRVYSNSSGEYLYSVAALYIARKREEMTIELGDYARETTPVNGGTADAG